MDQIHITTTLTPIDSKQCGKFDYSWSESLLSFLGNVVWTHILPVPWAHWHWAAIFHCWCHPQPWASGSHSLVLRRSVSALGNSGRSRGTTRLSLTCHILEATSPPSYANNTEQNEMTITIDFSVYINTKVNIKGKCTLHFYSLLKTCQSVRTHGQCCPEPWIYCPSGRYETKHKPDTPDEL